MIKGTAVILIGPQGCGKGTQAQALTDGFKFAHIAMSDVLKKISDPRLESEVALDVARGRLVRDEVTIGALEMHLDHHFPDYSTNITFDGVPRQIGQARLLHNLLCKRRMVQRYFIFELSDEVARRRIAGRIRDLELLGLPVRGDDLDPVAVSERLTTYRSRLPEMVRFLQHEAHVNITSIPEDLGKQEIFDMIWASLQPMTRVLC